MRLRFALLALALPATAAAQATRLLRQPTVSTARIAFEYGGDLWITPRSGGKLSDGFFAMKSKYWVVAST